MSVPSRIFKKSLTSGGCEAPRRDVWVANVNDVSAYVCRQPALSLVKQTHIERPMNSLAAAEQFAVDFLTWCSSVGEIGRKDWPKVVALSQEFAEALRVRPVSRMALA